MEKLGMMDYALGALIIVYGGYLSYKSVTLYRKNTQMRKDYKQQHKTYDEVNMYNGYVFFFGVMAALGIFFAIFPNVKENAFYFRIAYVMVVIISAGMALDSIVKRRILFDDQGFLYEKAYYRYRSVLGISHDKGLMRNMQIQTLEEDKIMISRKMGEIFETHYKKWKKRKKNKK